MSWTLDDIKKSPVAAINQHLFKGNNESLPPLKKHKYGAKRTEVNGIVFDSAKEAKRYSELLLLLKAGEIGLLELQKDYELNAGGTHSLKYIADFVYMTKEGLKIVEDAKGYRTKEYLKKKRLMKKIHNITIKEV
jgi:hypothetical protein